MKKIAIRCGQLCATVLVLALCYYGYLFATGNVHVVIPHQVIRSAQLNPTQLKKVWQQYHIKSIIDMAPGHRLHQAELQFARAHHIRHIDAGISAHGRCTPAQLRSLTEDILQAPRPLLVHCRQGADRTGLAAAIALILQGTQPITTIAQQYSWRYGALSPTSVGKMTIPPYLAWSKQHHLPVSKLSFLTWIQSLLAPTHVKPFILA